MDRNRKTVAELLALKGRRQFTMLHVKTVDEAAAAEAVGRYPAGEHTVGIAEDEFKAFRQQLD